MIQLAKILAGSKMRSVVSGRLRKISHDSMVCVERVENDVYWLRVRGAQYTTPADSIELGSTVTIG